MRLQWILWKYLIGRTARAYNILDPVQLLAKLRSFSQPSEVQEPIELLRAGIIFQARGLINARVIQYNLNWIWPYWVVRQYDPADHSFVPRAFSFSHINLTHRDWTAVGRHDLPVYPLVDPHGMITPLFDGWSLDFWFIPEKGEALLPSKLHHVSQKVRFNPHFRVHTVAKKNGDQIESEASLEVADKRPRLVVQIRARSPRSGDLVVSLRPFNSEGISFVDDVQMVADNSGWVVNKKTYVDMAPVPDRVQFSNFQKGDVFHRLSRDLTSRDSIQCKLGLCSAAALFKVDRDQTRQVTLSIPLSRELRRQRPVQQPGRYSWDEFLKGTCRVNLPDERIQFLFENAVRTLLMLSAADVYPGPYTYRRFWFRDACLMLQPMLYLGFKNRTQRLLQQFMARQDADGYFLSQKGEWDSNGQVLWIIGKYQQATQRPLPDQWIKAILKGVRWIMAKRLPKGGDTMHGGLLPAGFSAEHLGPNDFYFWDDFWAIAGLRSAARISRMSVSGAVADDLDLAANDFEQTVWQVIESIGEDKSQGGIPASPYRGLDAGAIGSMVADYPLQLLPAGDRRIMATLNRLLEAHTFHAGFFQDMVHSGVNAYLTLDLAQTLLRAGDMRFRQLIETVADLASPTGNWPEAIHPFSGGGCMGDGQHGWAAAEWVMMIRNLFVREEGSRLVLGSGIFPQWLQSGSRISFGPALTDFGSIRIDLSQTNGSWKLNFDGQWHAAPQSVEIRVPGFEVQYVNRNRGSFDLRQHG